MRPAVDRSQEVLNESYAEATVALRRYARLLAAAYTPIADDDTVEAAELHRRSLFACIAATALEAAHGDERAREHLAVLAGAGRP